MKLWLRVVIPMAALMLFACTEKSGPQKRTSASGEESSETNLAQKRVGESVESFEPSTTKDPEMVERDSNKATPVQDQAAAPAEMEEKAEEKAEESRDEMKMVEAKPAAKRSMSKGESGGKDDADDDAPGGGIDGKKDKKKNGGADKPKVKTWKRSRKIPNTSKLTIGDNEELPLKGMQVKVDVQGFRARVLIDFFFYNDRDRQFEGTFKLRLPNDATPYFFAYGETALRQPGARPDAPAFDDADRLRRMGTRPERIMQDRKEEWQAPKEARMVPKEKAAFAYRETVRRRVDPALMEWAGAGIFSARVFPIAPRRQYRVVIGYDVDLTAVGEDLEYRFELPDKVDGLVVNLGMARVPGVKTSVTPEVEGVRIDDAIHYRYDKPAGEAIVLRLENPGRTVLVRDEPPVGPLFTTRLIPPLPKTEAKGSDTAVFVVDVSLTSNPDQFNVWLMMVKAILNSNRGQLSRFAVLFFNVEQFWWKPGFVENTDSNLQEFVEFADALALEGATDLGSALAEASHPGWLNKGSDPLRWDLFMLSDGAVTWGDAGLYSLSNRLKDGHADSLFAYRSGFQGTDSRMLAHLARTTGGAVFSVLGEAEVAAAATAHRNRPWVLESVTLAGTSDLLLAGRPTSLFPGQLLTLAGRGEPEKGAVVSLQVRQGADSKTISVPLGQVLDSELAVRAYGQVAVGQLEEFEAETEAISTAYARHFRITGRTCSLLMLESEEDYQRFGIKPEEDVFVIKTNPAVNVVAAVLESVADKLGDPAKAFMDWMAKMESMKFVNFSAGTAFKMALKSLPAEAFAVIPRPLQCKLHKAADMPSSLYEKLTERKIDYDLIVSEALRRADELGPGDALKAMSNLVENNPGDAVLARDVGFAAMQWGLGDQAYHLFRRVADSRPYEPQNYRAMALSLTDLGMVDLAAAYYEIALSGNWDGRFGEFRKIVGLDYLRFLRRAGSGEWKSHMPEFLAARKESVSREFDVGTPDILVTITWNTDGTDVDLHVLEPTGEECYYSHPETRIGGKLTQDVTQGYGPEMYLLHKAVPGTYRVRAKYFSSDWNRASARTKVYATVYRNWGTATEKVEKKVVTLVDNKDMHDIVTIKVK
jgi:hypothetical protein